MPIISLITAILLSASGSLPVRASPSERAATAAQLGERKSEICAFPFSNPLCCPVLLDTPIVGQLLGGTVGAIGCDLTAILPPSEPALDALCAAIGQKPFCCISKDPEDAALCKPAGASSSSSNSS